MDQHSAAAERSTELNPRCSVTQPRSQAAECETEEHDRRENNQQTSRHTCLGQGLGVVIVGVIPEQVGSKALVFGERNLKTPHPSTNPGVGVKHPEGIS